MDWASLSQSLDAVICISDKDVKLAPVAVIWYVPFRADSLGKDK